MKLVNQQEPLEGMYSRMLDVRKYIYVLFICKFGKVFIITKNEVNIYVFVLSVRLRLTVCMHNSYMFLITIWKII